jgi:hypothetical protein
MKIYALKSCLAAMLFTGVFHLAPQHQVVPCPEDQSCEDSEGSGSEEPETPCSE